MTDIGQKVSQVEQNVDKVLSDLKKLTKVVDHNILKRDQRSDQINQVLIESKKTTDKFKKETPALNVFTAASSDLRTMLEGRVPDPLVKLCPSSASTCRRSPSM